MPSPPLSPYSRKLFPTACSFSLLDKPTSLPLTLLTQAALCKGNSPRSGFNPLSATGALCDLWQVAERSLSWIQLCLAGLFGRLDKERAQGVKRPAQRKHGRSPPFPLLVPIPDHPASNAQHRASPALAARNAGICSFLVPKSWFFSEPEGERKNYTSQWAVKGKWGSENRASPPGHLRFRLPTSCAHNPRAQTPRQWQGRAHERVGPDCWAAWGWETRAVPLLPRGLAGDRREIKRANCERPCRRSRKKGPGRQQPMQSLAATRLVLWEGGRGRGRETQIAPLSAGNPEPGRARPRDPCPQPPSRGSACLVPSLPILSPGHPHPIPGQQ